MATTPLDHHPDWHVIEHPLTFRAEPAHTRSRGAAQLTGFLAIGPGGLFNVIVVHHGRRRILIAGDVVQIDGARPRYLAQARRAAQQAGQLISQAIRREIKVLPVLAFAGSGPISVNGLPKDCIITSYRELAKVLEAVGRRISPATAQKLALVARNPTTWADTAWSGDGNTPGDIGSTQE